MGRNYAYRTFTADASVVIPAGTEKVRIVVEKKYIQVFGASREDGQGSNNGSQIQNMFIDQNGRGWGMGSNVLGQLGNGTQVKVSVPIAMVGAFNFVAMLGDNNGATGAYYGMSEQGLVFAWGCNTNGQLGLNDVTHRSSPVVIPGSWIHMGTQGGSNWYGISSGGQIYGMGFGPSISGDTLPKSSPTAAVGVSGMVFKKVFTSFGTGNIYFLRSDNKLYGAGVNITGSLGVGDLVGRSSPVAVGAAIDFKYVANVGLFAVGLSTAGVAWSWGQSNSKGQLGTGNNTASSTPIAVVGNLTFQQIVAHAGNSVYGLTTAGVPYAWGDNTNGQLCVGDVVARSSPVAVLGLGGAVIKKIIPVQSGHFGTSSVWFIATDGTVYAGGGNTDGELGVGDVTPRSSAVAVLGGFKFLDLQGGMGVIGICDDGVMRAWGLNDNGQLGLNDVLPRSSPVVIPGVTRMLPIAYRDEKIVDVTPGSTYALKMANAMGVLFGTESISTRPFVDNVTIYFEN